jgi:hypothetical protein
MEDVMTALKSFTALVKPSATSPDDESRGRGFDAQQAKIFGGSRQPALQLLAHEQRPSY